MIDFKIKIPVELNDIPLSQWQEFYELSSKKDIDSEFLNRRALNIFFGIRGDLYSKIKSVDIEALISSLATVFKKEAEFEHKFELDGVRYGFLPNLDDMSFGEFVDLDEYKEAKDYHKLMSVLFRPIKDEDKNRYTVDSYTGTHDKFKDMPLGVALGCIGFFLTIVRQLVNDILKSSIEEHPQEMERILEESGLGMLQSTLSPWVIFPNSKILFDLMLTPYSQKSPITQT